jgi:hypothetical protein
MVVNSVYRNYASTLLITFSAYDYSTLYCLISFQKGQAISAFVKGSKLALGTTQSYFQSKPVGIKRRGAERRMYSQNK